MEIRKSEAIVLHHLDYGEADRIVTLLTPAQGLLKGFARNARKSRRRFGAAFETFASVELQWTERGGDLASLREADLVNLRAGLRKDLGAMVLAGYGCELVEALAGQEPHREVYRMLKAFLDHLETEGGSPTARLLLDLRLLSLCGYAPHLLHCSCCGGALESEAFFDIGRGGSLCCGCSSGRESLRAHTGTLGSLARSLKAPVDLFSGFRFGPRTLQEGGALLRSALFAHLCRPPKSLPMLDSLLPMDGNS